MDGGIAEQTERVLENIRAILEAERLELASVVKTTVFLVDMADFAAMNTVYARAFGDHRPARSTVAVAALPRGARVEIEAVGGSYLPEPGERIGPGGLAGLQNRDGGAFGGSGGFDSHTLPPPAACAPPAPGSLAVTLALGRSLSRDLALLLGSARPPAGSPRRTRAAVAAADTAPARAAVRDSHRSASARWAPSGARSCCPAGARPGSAASSPAGIFIAWEGTTLGMSLKTRHELALSPAHQLRARRGQAPGARGLAGAARPSIICSPGSRPTSPATSPTFPADLRLQAVPGGVGASISVPIRIR